MDEKTPGTTLVVGGTGTTGSRVARGLEARGVAVRIGSRSGEPPFDWADRATWARALDGASSAYVVYAPDIGSPGAAEAVGAFARLAVDSGVTRLVLLSGRGEAEAQRSEQALRDSGAEWTVVQASFFAQSFTEGFMADAVRSGLVRFPAGDVAEPFIDVDDVAAVAVAALTEPGHERRVVEVTGPRLLTFAEAMAEISAASGREVRYQPVTPEQFADGLVAGGRPAEHARRLALLFRDIFDGHNAYLADGVRRVLGREPRDFREFARSAATALAG